MLEFIYMGPDEKSRPIFKNIDNKTYICSTEILVPNEELKLSSKSSIVEYFNNNKDKLVFYGHKARTEPDGRKLDPTKFKVVK